MTKNIIMKTLFSKSDKKIKSDSENEGFDGPAEFETAVAAVGFGKFNYILFLILIPSQWAITFDVTLMSYIAPIAQCDLNLSLNDRGIIMAVPPFGGIVGAILWGVLLDTLGRKNLILYGFMLEGIVTILTSFSQSYIYLLTLKLISGALSGGLYIAGCTYYAEFHSMEHRSKMQLAIGFIAGSGHVILPLISSFFLPLQFNITLFNGYLKFHSWNLLILVTSVLSFISAIVFIFLPESPKYMMTKGNNEEALSIFKKVYKTNNGLPEDTFPIGKLIVEQNEIKYGENEEKFSLINYVRNGWHQLKPIFSKKYFPKLILVTAIEFLIIADMNTLKLWLPQIFQGIHEYQAKHNGTTTRLCTMLESLKTMPTSSNTTMPICAVNTDNNFSVYLNSVINAVVCMVGYAMAGTLINMLGKKKLLYVLGLVSTVTISTTYWSQNTLTTLALTSLYLAATAICFDVVMTMIVVIFPTTLRATAISTMLMVGRSGSIMGSVLFPILLKIGCAPPFITLGSLAIVATLLCIFLPVSDNDSLK